MSMKNLIPAIAAMLLAAGCAKPLKTLPPYYGPTDTMAQVVRAVNDNNSKIKTLWSSHTFEATLVDEKGKSHSFSGDGYLLFMKPENMLLTAGGIIKFFEVGSNDEQYWFTAYPDEVSTQWWGEKGKLNDQTAKQIPIRPDLLLEVLGVSTIEEDFMQMPAPVMRFNNDAHAYMFVWSKPVQNRWVAVKETWYDLETKLPRSVHLFDINGRIILRAYLTEPETIKGTTAKMPSKFDLFFPETRSQMTFKLTDIRPSIKKGPVTIPNPASFSFPAEPGVKKQIEIK